MAINTAAIDKNLLWWILGALALAVLVALVFDKDAAVGGAIYNTFDFVGDMFLNALKMIVVPLILASIIVGIANMASMESFGRVGGKTIGFYVVTGFLSIFTGLILVNLFAPGTTEAAPSLIENKGDMTATLEKVEGRDASDIVEILKRMIPPNIFEAAAKTQLLALIFVGVVFGFFMSKLTGPLQETLTNFWTAIHDVMIMITMWIMRFAPLGVLALVGEVLLDTGFQAFVPLGWFAATVLLALAIHTFGWLPLMLRYIANIKPYAYYSKVVRAQLTAFSTASSSATLPVTLNSAQQAGVSKRVSSFVLPLGATVNMDGTAMYECVVVIFIAQLYAYTAGVDFTIADQLVVVLLALLTSIGVAGIPAASLVAIVLILTALDLPVELIGIVLVVDRILDMCRTAVNVSSDLTISALIANSEGEELDGLRPNGPAGADSEAA